MSDDNSADVAPNRTPNDLTQAERARRHAITRVDSVIPHAHTYEEAVAAVEGLTFAEVRKQLSHDQVTTIVCAILSTDIESVHNSWFHTLDSPTGMQRFELRGEGHAVHITLRCHYGGEYTLESWVPVDTPQKYDESDLSFDYEYHIEGKHAWLPSETFDSYAVAQEALQDWLDNHNYLALDESPHVRVAKSLYH